MQLVQSNRTIARARIEAGDFIGIFAERKSELEPRSRVEILDFHEGGAGDTELHKAGVNGAVG